LNTLEKRKTKIHVTVIEGSSARTTICRRELLQRNDL